MTSTVGGGSLISRQKEQSCVNYVCDKGEGVKKSDRFVDVIYGSPVNLTRSEPKIPAAGKLEGEICLGSMD